MRNRQYKAELKTILEQLNDPAANRALTELYESLDAERAAYRDQLRITKVKNKLLSDKVYKIDRTLEHAYDYVLARIHKFESCRIYFEPATKRFSVLSAKEPESYRELVDMGTYKAPYDNDAIREAVAVEYGAHLQYFI